MITLKNLSHRYIFPKLELGSDTKSELTTPFLVEIRQKAEGRGQKAVPMKKFHSHE
jgi:hypothetical protein